MFNTNARDWRGVAFGVLLLVLGFGVGYVSGGRLHGAGLPTSVSGISGIVSPPQNVDLTPVWKAWHVLDQKYVAGNQPSTTTPTTTPAEATQNRVWGMISGMADSLNDPYTFFLPPSEDKAFNEDISGSFQGVGMQIELKNGIVTVVSPLKGTPAERAGIKAGDQVLKIDGKDTKGMDVGQAVKLIRGPEGTNVTLLILRDTTAKPFELSVTREVINVPTITTTARPDGVFVIRLDSFTATSPELFRNALREFVQSGDTRLILDLRGNPGGYLDAAVDMASWFLPQGKVVVTEDFGGKEPSLVHRSRGYDVFNSNLKMLILVDRGSASASEILAGALQAHGVAKLVGTNTFGKGSVQELVPITSDTSLKVTVARWLSPSGKQIPITGIVPDYQIDISEADAKAGKDPQLEKAISILLSK